MLGHATAPRLIIHGDFTTDNILVEGEPPSIVGAIDFALATREVALAGLAFGLYRSGRPEPQAMALAPCGHARGGLCQPTGSEAASARALPVYLKARSLIVRWTRSGAIDCSPTLERLRHIAAQQDELQAALASVLEV